ncbi:MAG: aminomethyl-transferring glycine dehydrogenase subunit GcvPB [Desulfobacterales bacterium]|nr:aminomethyl-transferring glycine dehydrogenase subunit GcvPB [Desulfobacterales bacterium]
MKGIKLRNYHAAKYDEPIIMEMGVKGRRGIMVPPVHEEIAESAGDIKDLIPEKARRKTAPNLPEIDQYHTLMHFLRLSQMTLGMETGIDIGEGTCTMKYSPKVNEELVRSPKMADVHPLQPESTLQGILQITYELRNYLKAISGLDEFSMQTGGGAHATYINACITRKYHQDRGELEQRNEVITTQFTHPCNAATPATAGFKVIFLPHKNGYPDIDALNSVVSDRTAAIHMTNPEDTGIYNPRVKEFTKIVHDAGGLCFYDQANANGIMGIARAREAGFDACHFNLHKTFSSPHGCEGPAGGAYGCTEALAPYLPIPLVTRTNDHYHLDFDRPKSIGKVRSFFGNLEVVLRAYAWIRSMGPEGLKTAAEISVLNNQYLTHLLLQIDGITAPFAEGKPRFEQVRFSMEKLKDETGFGSHEIQDRMVDFGIQSYWLSHHPYVVPEPFTPEPCETYSKEDIEYWASVIEQACKEARETPEVIRKAPHNQAIHRIKDFEQAEDAKRWATTWRAYQRKRKNG